MLLDASRLQIGLEAHQGGAEVEPTLLDGSDVRLLGPLVACLFGLLGGFSTALTHLEAVMMNANAGIVRNKT